MSVGDEGVWVTLDWGTPKVHLASGQRTPFGNEIALCGEARAGEVREGCEDEVDAENLCARCLLKRHSEQARGEGE